MNRKIIALAMLCGLLAAVLVAQQLPQKPSGTTKDAAHYQLISAQVVDQGSNGQDVTSHALFLLDAASGKVWRYETTFTAIPPGGKVSQLYLDRFYPVEVDASRLRSK
jgi:hypothetical protein